MNRRFIVQPDHRRLERQLSNLHEQNVLIGAFFQPRHVLYVQQRLFVQQAYRRLERRVGHRYVRHVCRRFFFQSEHWRLERRSSQGLP
jgi:hypothetical protein